MTADCCKDEVNVNEESATETGNKYFDLLTKKGKKKRAIKCDDPPSKKHCSNVDTRLHQLVQDILCGNELSDDHMAIACKLLKKAFPSFGGMQSTLLAQTNGFSPVLSSEDSVQLHHTGQFHWVASALLKGKVYVFDSYKGISSSMKVQLPLIYKSLLQPGEGGKKTLAIEYPRVSQQIGRKDCGVFAIAFAFHAGKQFFVQYYICYVLLLANGDDLSRLKMKQSEMRHHLANCFSKGCINSFPHRIISTPVDSPVNQATIAVYCDCELP